MARVDVNNQYNRLQSESIHKESRARWGHAATSKLRDGFLSSRTPLQSGGEIMMATPRTRKSAALGYLEEKLNLHTDPTSGDRPATREILYRGISHDGGGRKAYLKLRKQYDVHQRHGKPLTESHSYGTEKAEGEYRASPLCKKPVIKDSFFREQGVKTYCGLPGEEIGAHNYATTGGGSWRF
eukprot:gnl/MRDRNA2_/MRDRNA2_97712_c0_seq1.p1 gnl/MRDRNA2_/MRDRNA2_97712_c0~~gnl/MRDRNA2_/MRDRNA2_97712_c0_seq1.p1  ORF type:complete len:183 (-),score=30.10 gnl/MRDRNA2_/MRDRNA2_97712_c0_seq1:187-735(-)